MPQLILELFSEEVPARMQENAEDALARALQKKLADAGLQVDKVGTFSGPRRLGAVIDDLPAKAADVSEERKGPRVGGPEQAIQGFLKSAGLKSIAEAQIVEDKKGAFYVARIARTGRATPEIVQEIIPDIIRAFPWSKSMRSGVSDLQWVRPLHNIMCLYDGAPVKIAIDGVPSEPVTWGHRFHAPAPIEPKDFADYVSKLRAAKVEIDRQARKTRIIEAARKLCAAKKLELVEDIGLLEELAGLAEWPVVLLGDMNPAFLDLPGEVIRLSMRTHQKYFAVRDPKTKALAPHFITVANIDAKDGGRAIAAGNARVLSARLNDARFFWDTDRKTPLYTEERRKKLEQIVFHQKLGSVWDKVERVKALAKELAPVVWSAPLPLEGGGAGEGVKQRFESLEAFTAAVERAALLCKMDLVTETVGEFPELQGQVGRALAELEPLPLEGGGAGEGVKTSPAAGSNSPHPPTPSPSRGGGGAREHPSVAIAIEDHYRPLGPNDRVPSDPVAVTLALADKLDTLVSFWAIDEKPTGSSDPFALRRAALGVVRTLIHNSIRLRLMESILSGVFSQPAYFEYRSEFEKIFYELGRLGATHVGMEKVVELEHRMETAAYDATLKASEAAISLLAFLADRLKVQLRDQGKRHDLVDAVFALGDDDLVRIVARVQALDAFLKSQDGANLLAASKRAANILSAEEKKGKWSADDAKGEVDATKLVEPAEKSLHAALAKALPAARAAVEKEDFAAAMKALAALRAPVDAFFDKVLVNAEDASLRRNRLLLLSRFTEALSAVADFSKIEG